METTFLLALTAAFVLGVEHAFEPDHVVAVSTIVTRSKGLLRSLLTGSLWGIGHTVTLLLAGILVILLRVELPTSLTATFELFVGVMLVALGIWTLARIRKRKIHFHVHSHDGKVHAHLHSHQQSETHEHAHIPFSIGIVHGLAGSGGLVVLVMSTMTDVGQGLFFIGAFGVGLILAMSLISSALSLPVAVGGRFSELIGWFLSAGAGILSTALGLFVVAGFFV